MHFTDKQWTQLHYFLLDLYPKKQIDEIQRYTMEQLNTLIPHKRSMFDLGVVKDNAIQFFHPISLNIPQDAMDEYYKVYQKQDYTIWNFSLNQPMVYKDSQLLDNSLREGSAIYQKWMKPLGVHFGLGCTIVKEHFYGSITLFRPESGKDFSYAEYELLSCINEHLSSHMHTLFPKGISEKTISRDEKSSFSDYSFTPRETEIASLILKGFSNQEIASQLYISETTVKKHVGHVFAKAKVSNRMQLIAKLSVPH